MKKAVVLLSGGLDSATALYLARSEGYDTYCLSFNYGQRHGKELASAKKVAAAAGAKEHIVVDAGISAWGGSALTDSGIDVPKAGRPARGSLPPMCPQGT